MFTSRWLNGLLLTALIVLLAACSPATGQPPDVQVGVDPNFTAAAGSGEVALTATVDEVQAKAPAGAASSQVADSTVMPAPPVMPGLAGANPPNQPPISETPPASAERPTSTPTPDPLGFSINNEEDLVLLSQLSSSALGGIAQAAWAPDARHMALSGPLGVGWLKVGSFSVGSDPGLDLAWVNPDLPSSASLQINRDGTRLLVLGSGGRAVLLNTADGSPVAQMDLQPPAGNLEQVVSLSPDGGSLAVASDNHVTLYAWDTGAPTLALDGQDGVGAIVALAFSPDGRKLMAGSQDGDVQVWNLASGTLTRHEDSGRGDTFSCASPGYPVAPGGMLALICRWPSDDQQVDNIEIWMWDPANDRSHYVNSLTATQAMDYAHFAFGPGRSIMGLVAGGDQQIWTISGDFRRTNTLPAQWMTGWAFSPANQGKVVAIWDAQSVRFYDTTNASLLGQYTLPGSNAAVQELILIGNPVMGVGQGRLLALGRADGVVELWNAANGQQVHVFEPLAGSIVGLSAAMQSPGTNLIPLPGPWLAVGSAEGDIRLWNLISDPPVELGRFTLGRALYALAINPDGSVLAVSAQVDVERSPLVSLWDPVAGTQVGMLETGGAAVSALVYSPDGASLAVGNFAGEVQIWNANALTLLETIDTGSGSAITDLVFSPDGSMLAVVSGDRFQVWDAAQAAFIRGYVSASPQLALAFSPDQCSLAVNSGPALDVLDIPSGAFYLTESVDSDDLKQLSLAFSPDGRMLASGLNDGRLMLWGVPGSQEGLGKFPKPVCGLLSPFPTATPVPVPTNTPTLVPTATSSPTPNWTPTYTPTPPALARTLYLTDPHMRGEDVRALQERLIALGYTELNLADGDFGASTDGALRRFQQLNNLLVDGIVGQVTWTIIWAPNAVRGD